MKKITTILLTIFAIISLVSCVTVTNKVPTLTFDIAGLDTSDASNYKLEVLQGTNYDPLKGVSASDKEDGTLTVEVNNSYPDGEFKNAVAGTEFDVTYTATDSKGAVVSKVITIIVVRADSLDITPPTKTTYVKDEAFQRAGLVVVAVKGTQRVTLVAGEFVIDEEASLTANIGSDLSVLVRGAGTTGSFNINVEGTQNIEGLVSLTVTGDYRTVYGQGSQELNTDGLIVTAIFSDGTKEIIDDTDYIYTGFNTANAGTITINVFYGGKSTNFNLTVKAATAPTFYGVTPIQSWYIGMKPWDALDGVTAIDEIDGDLTSIIKVEGLTPLTFIAANQTIVKLSVKNQAGISKTVNITLNVFASSIPKNLTGAGSTADKPITIKFANGMGAEIELLLNNYARDFEAFYAAQGIFVKVIIETGAGGYDALKEATTSRITAATDVPNIVQGYPDHVAEYLTTKSVVALNPYINSLNWGFDVNWGFASTPGYTGVADATQNGETFNDIIESYRVENSQYDSSKTFYSLPFNKSTEVMTYNKTALEAAGVSVPTTWQELVSSAPALRAYGEQQLVNRLLTSNPAASEADKTAAKNRFVPAAYDSTGNAFITFTRQFGGAYTGYDPETKKGSLLWNSSAATYSAMEYVRSIGAPTTGIGSKVLVIPDFWSQSYASTPFQAGETFITIGSSAGVRYNKPSDDSFELGVAPIPYDANHPELRQVIQQGTNLSVLAGSKTTEYEKLVSYLFIKWLIRDVNTVDLAIATGYLPVRESAYASVEFQHYLGLALQSYADIKGDKDRNNYFNSLSANAAYAQREYMFSDPAFPGSSKARTEVGLAIVRIMTGDGNITAALKEAYDNANI